MYEMVIPLKWNSIDRLLSFMDSALSGCGQSAQRRAQLSVLVEEMFSTAIDSGSTGNFGCRIQPPNRMVLRFDSGESPADLTHFLSLARRLTPEGIQITPGLNSCLVAWD